MVCRIRTPLEYISYGLYLFFRVIIEKGIRKTVLFCQAKPRLNMELDSEIPSSKDINKKKIFGQVVDETLIKVGSGYIWLWAAIEPKKNKQILASSIPKERNKPLLLKGLSRVWSRFMESAWYQMMVVERGIPKPAGS